MADRICHISFTKYDYFVSIKLSYVIFLVMGYIDIKADSEFEEQVIGGGVCVVDFWAEWCGPCKMVEPILNELTQEFSGKISFFRINVDELVNLSSKYGVQSIPTMIIFQQGREVNRIIGAHPKNDYVSEMKKYL